LLLDSGAFPADSWMRQVASELNLPVTAFAHPLTGAPDADWALRWFTPVTEVQLCGHATLATAHVLRTTGAAHGTIRFRTAARVVPATASGDGTITLDFPLAPLIPVEAPEGLATALGTKPLTVLDTGPDLGDLLVEVADECTVRDLAPDFRTLAGISGRGVIATAAAGDPGKGYDFVSRSFFPRLGIDEDQVTGSAHTALAPFWSRRLGRDALTGLQASARTGRVATRLSGDRVLVTGAAVTVVDGELHAVP
jgi:PhzF family phenazine biosynthesis protein